jgi:phosphoadenosine phosphosulfate reductase
VNHSIEQVAGIAESWEARDVLAWGFRTYGDALQIASGFGVEGMVLIDIAIRIQRNLRVFTTDTGFLFPETYALMQRVEQRYGIQVERLQPALSPEAQANLHGPSLGGGTRTSAARFGKWSPSAKSCAHCRPGRPPSAVNRPPREHKRGKLRGTRNSLS